MLTSFAVGGSRDLLEPVAAPNESVVCFEEPAAFFAPPLAPALSAAVRALVAPFSPATSLLTRHTTPLYPALDVDTAQWQEYPGTTALSCSSTSTRCCSCSLCSCRHSTCGFSSLTSFCRIATLSFLSAARSPPTFHDRTRRLLSFLARGFCLGVSVRGSTPSAAASSFASFSAALLFFVAPFVFLDGGGGGAACVGAASFALLMCFLFFVVVSCVAGVAFAPRTFGT
mmetsp:Transcript_1004/g.2771  ORF Transcript_1004/g.2771 Transcript_1004/m.2771 type:complete len:228 (+) Transcript_1004:689-1372(+)